MRFAAFLLILALAPSAYAIDGASTEGGGGYDVRLARVGVDWRWPESWRFAGYNELSIGAWDAADGIIDIGFTPVFRFERSRTAPYYFEAAIGFHYLSGTHITGTRTFGTRFEFGDHIGAGLRFGEHERYELGVRLQHVSNAGIKEPNPGINFLLLRFALRLD